jgi:hypothetical protein
MATDHEIYLGLREKWVQEDNLLDQRVTWLLLSQTILFAAYCVMMQIPKDSPHVNKAAKLLAWFPLFGIALTCIISIAIVAAVSAQQQIKTYPDSKRFNVYVGGGLTWLGYIPPIALPVLFIVAWLITIAV